jgi:hypothetical protein
MRNDQLAVLILIFLCQPVTAMHTEVSTNAIFSDLPDDIQTPFGSQFMAWCDPSLCDQISFLSVGSIVRTHFQVTEEVCCNGSFTGNDITLNPFASSKVVIGAVMAGELDPFASIFEENTFGSLRDLDSGREITVFRPGTMLEVYIDFPHILEYGGDASPTTAPVEADFLVLRFDGTRERIDVLSLDIFNGGTDSQFIPLASNTVPVPPAVWLFGSALAILGWVRRRKLL